MEITLILTGEILIITAGDGLQCTLATEIPIIMIPSSTIHSMISDITGTMADIIPRGTTEVITTLIIPTDGHITATGDTTPVSVPTTGIITVRYLTAGETGKVYIQQNGTTGRSLQPHRPEETATSPREHQPML